MRRWCTPAAVERPTNRWLRQALPLSVDAFDGHAVALVPSEGAGHEVADGFLSLVGEHLGVGEAGGVVDGDVQELPAAAANARHIGADADDAVADVDDAAELLDVAVDQFARTPVFVALRRRWCIEPGQAAEADPEMPPGPARGDRRSRDDRRGGPRRGWSAGRRGQPGTGPIFRPAARRERRRSGRSPTRRADAGRSRRPSADVCSSSSTSSRGTNAHGKALDGQDSRSRPGPG